MNVVVAVVAVVFGLVVLALLVAPPVGIVVALVLQSKVRRFRAGAARVRGTVLESSIAASRGGSAVPNGAGGVSYIPSGVRIESRPVVSYPGPANETLTAQVRFGAPQIYVYGQPVDLLVDPADPRDVRLVAGDGSAIARRFLTMSITVAAVIAIFIATIVVLGVILSHR
jgi:hypothetical protein